MACWPAVGTPQARRPRRCGQEMLRCPSPPARRLTVGHAGCLGLAAPVDRRLVLVSAHAPLQPHLWGGCRRGRRRGRRRGQAGAWGREIGRHPQPAGSGATRQPLPLACLPSPFPAATCLAERKRAPERGHGGGALGGQVVQVLDVPQVRLRPAGCGGGRQPARRALRLRSGSRPVVLLLVAAPCAVARPGCSRQCTAAARRLAVPSRTPPPGSRWWRSG